MKKMDKRYSRQSFLGHKSQEIISKTRIGIIGLGGGGSHIAQQLAHVGFQIFVLLDPDIAKDVNLNRLVGATEDDIENKRLKVDIASRVIKGISSTASIHPFSETWQDRLNELKACDIIFGCIDGFIQRRDIEAFSRRFLIPYIDIGMDVHCVGTQPPRIAGQVILSMPGHACMHCIGFLTEDNLAKEGTRYGDAGENPQVVWCNGVLASTAVEIAIDLITDWSKSLRGTVYLSYDGNTNTLTPDNRMKYRDLKVRPHYPIHEVGEPNFQNI
jgi:hypothetical protein